MYPINIVSHTHIYPIIHNKYSITVSVTLVYKRSLTAVLKMSPLNLIKKINLLFPSSGLVGKPAVGRRSLLLLQEIPLASRAGLLLSTTGCFSLFLDGGFYQVWVRH